MVVLNVPVVDPIAAKLVESFPFHNAVCVDGKLLGSLWVISQIRNTLPVIHGPVGCSWQRRCALMGPVVHYYTPCTAWTEFEVIYGGEKKLADALVEAYKRYNPDMIVVLTTCASDLIGDDVEAAIETAKQRGVKCPIVYSTGLKAGKFRQVGSQDVLLSIVEQYVLPETEGHDIEEGTVNLMVIGGEYSIGIRQELAPLLKMCGVKVNKIYFTDVTVQDLLDLAHVELNIVPYTQLWANLLEQKRGIKTHVLCRFESSDISEAYPIGVEACKNQLVKIIDKLPVKNVDPEKVFYTFYEKEIDTINKLRSQLAGKRVVIENPWGPEILLALEFNLSIVGVIFWTHQFRSHGMSEKVVQEYISSVQAMLQSMGYDVNIIVDEPLEQVIEKVKRLSPDLVMCAWWSRQYEYDRAGLRTISMRQFHLFFDYGLRNLVRAGEKILKAINSKIVDRPIIPRTSASFPDLQYLPTPWDALAKLFYLSRYVWAE